MHEIRRRHLGFMPINQSNSGRRIYVAATNYPLVAAWFTENSRTQQEINEEIRGLASMAHTGDALNASDTTRCYG